MWRRWLLYARFWSMLPVLTCSPCFLLHKLLRYDVVTTACDCCAFGQCCRFSLQAGGLLPRDVAVNSTSVVLICPLVVTAVAGVAGGGEPPPWSMGGVPLSVGLALLFLLLLLLFLALFVRWSRRGRVRSTLKEPSGGDAAVERSVPAVPGVKSDGALEIEPVRSFPGATYLCLPVPSNGGVELVVPPQEPAFPSVASLQSPSGRRRLHGSSKVLPLSDRSTAQPLPLAVSGMRVSIEMEPVQASPDADSPHEGVAPVTAGTAAEASVSPLLVQDTPLPQNSQPMAPEIEQPPQLLLPSVQLPRPDSERLATEATGVVSPFATSAMPARDTALPLAAETAPLPMHPFPTSVTTHSVYPFEVAQFFTAPPPSATSSRAVTDADGDDAMVLLFQGLLEEPDVAPQTHILSQRLLVSPLLNADGLCHRTEESESLVAPPFLRFVPDTGAAVPLSARSELLCTRSPRVPLSARSPSVLVAVRSPLLPILSARSSNPPVTSELRPQSPLISNRPLQAPLLSARSPELQASVLPSSEPSLGRTSPSAQATQVVAVDNSPHLVEREAASHDSPAGNLSYQSPSTFDIDDVAREANLTDDALDEAADRVCDDAVWMQRSGQPAMFPPEASPQGEGVAPASRSRQQRSRSRRRLGGVPAVASRSPSRRRAWDTSIVTASLPMRDTSPLRDVPFVRRLPLDIPWVEQLRLEQEIYVPPDPADVWWESQLRMRRGGGGPPVNAATRYPGSSSRGIPRAPEDSPSLRHVASSHAVLRQSMSSHSLRVSTPGAGSVGRSNTLGARGSHFILVQQMLEASQSLRSRHDRSTRMSHAPSPTET